MSVDDQTLPEVPRDPVPLVFDDHEGRHSWSFRRYGRGHGHGKPRVRKVRLLLVLIGFLTLAGASTLFGMLTAIASDLPTLVPSVPAKSVDSYLYDETGQPIGVLAPPDAPVADSWGQISHNMRSAIVAIEDKRFWSDSGVDIRGLLRAATSDVTGGPREGGSTIPEQFVKNVRAEQDHRTIFEKLIEAGLAFQLTHKWKHTEILTDYLNSIYFGNGAYGIESAARVYFGWNHGYKPDNPAGESKTGCGSPDAEDPTRPSCASELRPWEAALLAGMVASPSEFDPAIPSDRPAAKQRRDEVLEDMYQQHDINFVMYEKSVEEPLPPTDDIQTPQEPAAAPYFTSWVTPLIVNALKQEGVPAKDAEYQAYYGNLKIHLTINLQLQKEAQAAVDREFPTGSGPTASLVAIDNKTGEVRAMVSGDNDYAKSPFNLATLGYRQPGSAFKIFTLAAALTKGTYGPGSVIESEPLTIRYGPGHAAKFVVHNFDNAYAGETTLASATATSDNSVFARVGWSVGTGDIASYARNMGIRSPISTYPSMILGGLTKGVSALDMAHAYETVADGGKKVTNSVLGDVNGGPIGIASIQNCAECRQHDIKNTPADGLKYTQVLTPEVADTITDLLHGPIDDPSGTGTAAAIPGVDVAGKTGTTSNYVDAWFVGWTPQMTVAVWVGYPNSGKPMTTNFDGGPVEGGTYPAIIWHNFMIQALQTMADEAAAKDHTTAPNLGLQSVTTAAQQSNAGTQNTTTTAQTQGTDNAKGTNNANGADNANGTDATNGTAGTGTTKTPPPGTQPTAPVTKTGGTTKGTTATPSTPSTGATQGTQPVPTTPAVTTTSTTAQTGTSTSGGAGL